MEEKEQKKPRVKKVIEPKIEKDVALLKEIAELEAQVVAKQKEYSEYIASKRVINKQPSVHECLQMAMRDDKNSDRKKLQKVTAMALDSLKKSK